MSEKFYEVCYNCQRTFTDRAEFEEHKRTHGKGRKQSKPIEEVKKQAAVNTAAKNDGEKQAAISEVNMMKKLLIAAGVDAQTMTAEQVKIRYAEEKAKGNVK